MNQGRDDWVGVCMHKIFVIRPHRTHLVKSSVQSVCECRLQYVVIKQTNADFE